MTIKLNEQQQVICLKYACQIVSSRTDLTPGSIENPDRMEREQRQNRDACLHYGGIASTEWCKRNEIKQQPEGLDKAMAARIAELVYDASVAESRIDRAVMVELASIASVIG